MNFYKHHIGDYDANTSHLTWLEDMAYTRLMRLYYRREIPIPTDVAQACRLVRASSKQEREAVESVLNEFFVLSEDGWHNKRCDEEIGSANVKADKNREVGKLGGRPKKKETKEDIEKNHDGFEKEPSNNPSQTPDTRHQTPDLKPEVIHTVSESESHQREIPPDSAPVPPSTPAGEACLAIREAGIQTTNPSHPTLIALLNAGADADEFRIAAREAVAKGKADFAYVIGTVRKRREEAAALVLHQGRMPNKQEALEASNRSATAGWKPPELRENIA